MERLAMKPNPPVSGIVLIAVSFSVQRCVEGETCFIVKNAFIFYTANMVVLIFTDEA
jgi:hypothetical protein